MELQENVYIIDIVYIPNCSGGSEYRASSLKAATIIFGTTGE